ncbi:hypothetical protein [Klebsiella pasteurii]|uniref:hypothetical protein n=1 Tax=Klebsiella pasteurii TaxID=2587529 RepID=UPI001BADE890|nr:hypothetical protein [Klebsiella pasteurii]QUE98807.1 hypothetical protein KCG39_12370 [Klebsiella pasteurii]
MLLENEVDNAKRLAVNQSFWVSVLMCVDYISALKEATSYKFLFKGFWSIKYSASGCFLFVTLLLFLVFIFFIFFQRDSLLLRRGDRREAGRKRTIARQNRVAVGSASLLAFFTLLKANCQHDMLI